MRYWHDYLIDQNFLEQILTSYSGQYFVKIHGLTWEEENVQDVEGKAISLNVNLDGQSSMRRTANVTFIANDLNSGINKVENVFSINKKIFLEIGYSNNSNKYQDESIIWFPLGLYVIASASLSHSLSGWTISLQLKDKMALLNGQCGGVFPASVVFDNYDTIDNNGEIVVSRPTIYRIISELVNHWGKEQLGRILISDLDTKVKKVMKWVGGTPLYYFKYQTDGDNPTKQYFVSTNYNDGQKDENKVFKQLRYSPYEYGRDVGYVYTDFTFPGDLIANAGDTITSILDKIINVLGNYEYFYDVYGNFIFQQKKNYLNVAQPFYVGTDQNIFTADIRYALNKNKGKSVFSFNNSNLINSYNNTPQYALIKNDFVIWGLMKNSNQVEIPIRYHLAIDKKPLPGNTYSAIQYTDSLDGLQKWKSPIDVQTVNDFPPVGEIGEFYNLLKASETYERGIYQWVKVDDGYYTYQKTPDTIKLQDVTTKDWRTQLYFQGVISEPYGVESNDYYAELKNEWPRIYNIIPNEKIQVIKEKGKYYKINQTTGIKTSEIVGNNSTNTVGQKNTQLQMVVNKSYLLKIYTIKYILINDNKEKIETTSNAFYSTHDSCYKIMKIEDNNAITDENAPYFYFINLNSISSAEPIFINGKKIKFSNYYKSDSGELFILSNDGWYKKIQKDNNNDYYNTVEPNKRYYLRKDLNNMVKQKTSTIDNKQVIEITINESDYFQDYKKYPDRLPYFLDFIDASTSAEISELAIPNIGRRTYSIDKGSSVNCIFQPELEDVVFIKNENKSEGAVDESTVFDLRTYCINKGQEYLQIPSTIYDALTIGGEMYSAYEEVRQILHEYTSYNETISLQTLPLFFLQPNTRITVFDEESHIYGDYLINSLSFAIGNNSTLTINATRALEKI